MGIRFLHSLRFKLQRKTLHRQLYADEPAGHFRALVALVLFTTFAPHPLTDELMRQGLTVYEPSPFQKFMPLLTSIGTLR